MSLSRFITWRHASLLLPIAVLLVSVAAQGRTVFREAPQPRSAHLAKTIPVALEGWHGREVPLGPNEFVSSEVEKVLNYDEVINREYSRAGEEFGVYVAYWGPGKMPTRFVASHTPDRCWTENGMHCLDMKFKYATHLDDHAYLPSEWRLFETANGDKRIYVQYWHLVEGRLYDYGQRFNNVPSPLLWWKDAVQQAVLGSREQYFIRITSNQPIEGLWNDPGFRTVMRGLGQLGLAGTSASAN